MQCVYCSLHQCSKGYQSLCSPLSLFVVRNAERQKLFSLKVISYCLLALHSSPGGCDFSFYLLASGLFSRHPKISAEYCMSLSYVAIPAKMIYCTGVGLILGPQADDGPPSDHHHMCQYLSFAWMVRWRTRLTQLMPIECQFKGTPFYSSKCKFNFRSPVIFHFWVSWTLHRDVQ